MAKNNYHFDLLAKIALSSNEYVVLQVNGTEARRIGTIQFSRALRDMSIELICNCNHAKERVKRDSQTLQARHQANLAASGNLLRALT